MASFKRFILAVLVVALIGGVVFWFTKNKKQDTKTPTPDKTEKLAPIKPVGLISEKYSDDYAEVELSYPKCSASSLKEICDFVKQSKSDFKENYVPDNNGFIKKMIQTRGAKYSLVLNTKSYTSLNTVTYVLELYADTGGAHGGTTENTFTYYRAGKLLTLDDVFAPNNRGVYMQKIVPMARTYLYNKLGTDSTKEVIDSGTDPESNEFNDFADNYRSWYLTKDSLVFIFGQYQVGPYVIGIQEFPIEKSQIRDLLGEDFK
jgi:hypothetical protein